MMLGRGGMADVYEAIQENLDRKVAIKVIIPELFRDTSFTARFVKEAQTAAKLTHPNVLHIYDVGATPSCNYIVMECLFESLKERLKRERQLPREVVLGVMRQMGQALDYAHRKGIVHRDVKPDNILFREDGTPVLTDFGIAKAVDSTTKLTRTGMSVGTPHYMSPEQIQGLEVDGRADFYSLGIVFYEMLTGGVPYEATDPIAICMKHVHEPIPVLPPQLSCYQPTLERLLAKEPGKRMASGDELLRWLNELTGAAQKPSRIRKTLVPRPGIEKNGLAVPMQTQAYDSRDLPALSKKRTPPLVYWLAGPILALMVILFLLRGKKNNDSEGEGKHEPPPVSQKTEIARPTQEELETKKGGEPSPARLAEKKTEELGPDQEGRAGKPLLKENPAQAGGAVMKERPTQGQQPLAAGKKETPPKIKEPEAVRPGEEKTQKNLPTGDRSAVGELETIGLFELEAQLAQEYGKKFERVSISGIPENMNAFGQISVLLNVDATGRVAMNFLDLQMLTVDPLDQRARVRELLSLAFTQARLPAPKKRNGQSAVLGKWRLSFKIVTLAGKMTLIKQ